VYVGAPYAFNKTKFTYQKKKKALGPDGFSMAFFQA